MCHAKWSKAFSQATTESGNGRFLSSIYFAKNAHKQAPLVRFKAIVIWEKHSSGYSYGTSHKSNHFFSKEAIINIWSRCVWNVHYDAVEILG